VFSSAKTLDFARALKEFPRDARPELAMLNHLVNEPNEIRPGIHNAFIAASKQHPFITECIRYITNNIKNKSYGDNSLDITGPKALGKCFINYFITPIITGYHIYTYNKINYPIYCCELYSKDNNIRNQHLLFIRYDNKDIIKTKFENYKSVLYTNNNIPTYSELWVSRKVYKDLQ
jgi:hypothetical protein